MNADIARQPSLFLNLQCVPEREDGDSTCDSDPETDSLSIEAEWIYNLWQPNLDPGECAPRVTHITNPWDIFANIKSITLSEEP